MIKMNKKQLLKRLASVVFCLVLSLPAVFAQNKTVKGVVVDDTDQGVIGAAVMIKGTTTGVATDLDGNFELSCAPTDVLVISSVGYDDVEVTVGDKTTLRIQLNISSELLDDVVVIGYGTTRAKNFTGSVDVVKMSDSPVADLGLSNVSDMIRGRLSGVVLGAESATVGSTSSILVRGKKSVNATSTNPLLVVNGVIYTGNLEDIDQTSIESISVLKDATSLAAYGSKAANGVIMITLKKGEEGKPLINFTTSHQFSTPSFRPRFLSPDDYIKYMNARKGNSDLTSTSFMNFLEKANYEAGKTTDWFDLVTQTGYTQNYNLGFSGRTQNSNYRVAFGHSDQKGIAIGNEFVRNNVQMNLSTHISKYIELGTNMAYTSSLSEGVTATTRVKILSPYMEPYLPDGKTLRYYVEGVNNSNTNPLWSTQYGQDRENRRFNLNLGGYLSINIPWVEGLNFRMNASYTKVNSKNLSFTHENATPVLLSNDLEGVGQTAAYYNFSNAQGTIGRSYSENWVIDNILSYARAFGQHYVSASLVYTRDSSESTSDTVTGKGFVNAGETIRGWHALENADSKQYNGLYYTLATDVGYLARVIYSYRDTYHFNASFRRDGASPFGINKKWGNYPAIGGAWTVTNEKFMKDIKWLDFLKLKASWGMNGAQTISPYGTLSTIAVAQGGRIPNYSGGTIHWGQKIDALGNPDLGWQSTASWNAGFEADFLKGRIHIDVNAYASQTTDQIFDKNIPVMGSGVTRQKATMGRVDNKGVEINLNTVNIKNAGGLNWTSNWVFTLNRNKLVDLYGDGQDDVTNNLFLGYPLSVIYGYVNEGIFQDGPYAGTPIFYTADGQQTNNPSPDDRKILGYGDENFRLNWANTVRWKNWQLYVMFQGIFGGGNYGLGNNTFAYSTFDTTAICSAYDIPFWTAQDPNNTYPSPNYSDGKYQIYNSYGHVRLQDVSLSYDFSRFAQKINVRNARLTLSGRNLFFIAPNWKLSDPQNRADGGVGLPRACTLGLNITF